MPRLRSPRIAAAFAIAVTLVAPPGAAPRVWAQPAPDKSDAEASYKQHMSNGVKLYQDKNFEAAITEFDAAYRAKPKASPLVNIALCQKALFRYPKAITTLEGALGKHADSLSAADRKAAEDAIAELKGLLGYVKVKLVPPDAKLTVDGEEQPRGTADKPVPLGPGTHRLAAQAEGYATAERQVSVTSGDKDKVVDLTLTPDQGYVTIRANDAQTAIAIDQKAMGFGKWTGFLQPGTHFVQMYKPGAGRGFETQLVVAAGKAHQLNEGVGGLSMGGDEQDKKKEPPPPVRRGWYGLAAATIFGTTASINNFVGFDAGVGVGARVGFRPTTVIGLEGMFEYRGTGATGEAFDGDFAFGGPVPPPAKDAHASFTSARLGGNLRLMTRGRVARYVATAGAGVAFDSVSWRDCKFCDSKSGADFYAVFENGFELEFSRVFFGLTLQQMVSSFGALESNGAATPAMNEIPLQVGLGLRVGYGRW